MVARDERESSDSNGFKQSDTSNAGMGEEQEVPMTQSASAATCTQQQPQQVESSTDSPQTSRTPTQTQTQAAANLSSLLTPLCAQADLLLKGVHILVRVRYLYSYSHCRAACCLMLPAATLCVCQARPPFASTRCSAISATSSPSTRTYASPYTTSSLYDSFLSHYSLVTPTYSLVHLHSVTSTRTVDVAFYE